MTVNEWTWTDGVHTREIKSGSCQCWVFDTDPDGIDHAAVDGMRTNPNPNPNPNPKPNPLA